MPSPPKPWEQSKMSGAVAAPPTVPAKSQPIARPAVTAVTAAKATIPVAPRSVAAAVQQPSAPPPPLAGSQMVPPTMSGYSPYGPRYGTGYSAAYGTGYGTGYGSPYASRFGGGPGSYGGYGTYGAGHYGTPGGYRGYGGYGATGAYGSGGGVGGGAPGGPDSLTSQFNQSTAATFQMIQGIVTAFGGVAQMLESTYMAMHSSFYAMVSVAEQFGNLRDAFGSILGIFTIVRWVRTLVARLTGRPAPANPSSLTPALFARFEGRAPTAAEAAASATAGSGLGPPRANKKSLLLFLLAAFGLPLLMNKLIRVLAASHEQSGEAERRRAAATAAIAVDPAEMAFCRVLRDCTDGEGLAVAQGQLVAVLSRHDPNWWHCRTRDGRVGYVATSALQLLVRKSAVTVSAAESRANSLTSAVTSSTSSSNSRGSNGSGPGGVDGPSVATSTTSAPPAEPSST